MEMENLEKELNELTHEILYLYLIHRTYIRTQIKKYHLAKNGTYSDWTDAMVSSKCIETDLIMRLTKLDENSSGTHSIRSVWKIFDKINKNSSEKSSIRKLMKSYRTSIGYLKTKYRNKKLAHLSSGSRDSF
jgi:ribosomal protein S20